MNKFNKICHNRKKYEKEIVTKNVKKKNKRKIQKDDYGAKCRNNNLS